MYRITSGSHNVFLKKKREEDILPCIVQVYLYYYSEQIYRKVYFTCTIDQCLVLHPYADIPIGIVILALRPIELGCKSPGKILDECYRNAPRKT